MHQNNDNRIELVIYFDSYSNLPKGISGSPNLLSLQSDPSKPKWSRRLPLKQDVVGSSPTLGAKILMGVSSIGRAAGFDPVGYRFESCTPCQSSFADAK